MKCVCMSFDGWALKRGFWIYIWKVSSQKGVYFYVGRTGDSSSPNAASPFARIGQHLDSRPSAKGNSLARRLLDEGLDPCDCRFQMTAIGPLFPEKDKMREHKPFRDKMAALEKEVSELLRNQGLQVLGTHGSRK